MLDLEPDVVESRGSRPDKLQLVMLVVGGQEDRAPVVQRLAETEGARSRGVPRSRGRAPAARRVQNAFACSLLCVSRGQPRAYPVAAGMSDLRPGAVNHASLPRECTNSPIAATASLRSWKSRWPVRRERSRRRVRDRLLPVRELTDRRDLVVLAPQEQRGRTDLRQDARKLWVKRSRHEPHQRLLLSRSRAPRTPDLGPTEDALPRWRDHSSKRRRSQADSSTTCRHHDARARQVRMARPARAR